MPAKFLPYLNNIKFLFPLNHYIRTNNNTGLGVRGVFGLSVIPYDSPLDIFFEVGLLVGLTPDFGSAVDASLGIRFYP